MLKERTETMIEKQRLAGIALLVSAIVALTPAGRCLPASEDRRQDAGWSSPPAGGQSPRSGQGKATHSAPNRSCRGGDLRSTVLGKFYVTGQLELNPGSAPSETRRRRVKGHPLGSWEETWQRLRPVVECAEAVMTLRFRKRRVAQLQLNRANGSAVPLSRLPPHCGYSLHTSPRELTLVVRYDACHVTQEDGSYVLPLWWKETPVTMSCPTTRHTDSPSLCCSPLGMRVWLSGQWSAEETRVKVRGEWTPLLSLAQLCGYTLEQLDGRVLVRVPFVSCGITEKDGRHGLSLQMQNEELELSCPVAASDEGTPPPPALSPESRRSPLWAPPFYLAPPHYPHPTLQHKWPVTTAPPHPSSAPPTPDPLPGRQDYELFDGSPPSVRRTSDLLQSSTPLYAEAPRVPSPSHTFNPFYHYYHHPKIPQTPPDIDPTEPSSPESDNPHVPADVELPGPVDPERHPKLLVSNPDQQVPPDAEGLSKARFEDTDTSRSLPAAPQHLHYSEVQELQTQNPEPRLLADASKQELMSEDQVHHGHGDDGTPPLGPPQFYYPQPDPNEFFYLSSNYDPHGSWSPESSSPTVTRIAEPRARDDAAAGNPPSWPDPGSETDMPWFIPPYPDYNLWPAAPPPPEQDSAPEPGNSDANMAAPPGLQDPAEEEGEELLLSDPAPPSGDHHFIVPWPLHGLPLGPQVLLVPPAGSSGVPPVLQSPELHLLAAPRVNLLSLDGGGDMMYMVACNSPAPPLTGVTSELRVSRDESFTSFHPEAHLPLSLIEGRPIYLELQLLGPEEPDVVQHVHSCVAHTLPPLLSWVLDLDSCSDLPQHRTPHTRRMVTPNFPTEGSSVLGDPEIYFLCVIVVCSEADAGCSPGCTDGGASEFKTVGTAELVYFMK